MPKMQNLEAIFPGLLAQVVGYQPGTVSFGKCHENIAETDITGRTSGEIREASGNANEQTEPEVWEEFLQLGGERGC